MPSTWCMKGASAWMRSFERVSFTHQRCHLLSYRFPGRRVEPRLGALSPQSRSSPVRKSCHASSPHPGKNFSLIFHSLTMFVFADRYLCSPTHRYRELQGSILFGGVRANPSSILLVQQCVANAQHGLAMHVLEYVTCTEHDRNPKSRTPHVCRSPTFHPLINRASRAPPTSRSPYGSKTACVRHVIFVGSLLPFRARQRCDYAKATLGVCRS